ncbi:hypothetical protein MGWOODY_Hyp229 [hydrothermal vent metagenome]|uniref:Uncharacterized protein n=1 Tax=hydrothermal vent metagenome TaxID=652676 RepID=A0A170PTM5_9ZZZZ
MARWASRRAYVGSVEHQGDDDHSANRGDILFQRPIYQ